MVWRRKQELKARFRPRDGTTDFGGRPGLNVDFVSVHDAVARARNGSGETMTDIAARFGVSRGWLHKWIYPAIEREDEANRE